MDYKPDLSPGISRHEVFASERNEVRLEISHSSRPTTETLSRSYLPYLTLVYQRISSNRIESVHRRTDFPALPSAQVSSHPEHLLTDCLARNMASQEGQKQLTRWLVPDSNAVKGPALHADPRPMISPYECIYLIHGTIIPRY